MFRKIVIFIINVGIISVIGYIGSVKYKCLYNCVFLGIVVRYLDCVVLDIYEVL